MVAGHMLDTPCGRLSSFSRSRFLWRFSFAGNTAPRTASRRHVLTRAQQPGDEEGQPAARRNTLSATIRRKQQQVAQRLGELGEEALEERLQLAGESAGSHRLAQAIQECIPQGRPALALELIRGDRIASAERLAREAQIFAEAGADVLVVRTDSECTPEGTRDLWSVCRSVKVPVVAWDWYLHPLQLVEAKEAGAAGVVGVVASVLSRGTPIMSSYAASIGIDCPVEIVNAAELREMERFGVPFFGVGLSVGLSVSIPGFSTDVTRGLLGDLPFGAISMVGVRSLDEARTARAAGADCLLVKNELVAEYQGRVRQLIEQLRYVTSGDE